MKIEYPTEKASKYYFVQISECILEINCYLRNEYYEERYAQHFEWFKESIPNINRLLSLGCGYGRETLALNKSINAVEVIGIDKDSTKIVVAKKIANEIYKFSQLIEQARHELQNDEYNFWYKSIPMEIINYIPPKYLELNITKPFSTTNNDFINAFDLIYCRYVLHLIYDENEENIITVMHNLKLALKPETGRLVVVEPSIKGDKKYDFTKYFTKAGLFMLTDPPVDKNSLGIVQWPECNPFGYIMKTPCEEK